MLIFPTIILNIILTPSVLLPSLSNILNLCANPKCEIHFGKGIFVISNSLITMIVKVPF